MDASSPAHHVAAGRKSPSSRTPTWAVWAFILVAGLIVVATGVDPAIDLAVARLMLLPADSPARPAILVLREVFRFTPYFIFVLIVAVVSLRAVKGLARPAYAGRRALFLAAVLALGPGLAVNAGLKTYSHRPRPVQTVEAGGGSLPFRPFFRFDGACARNCSFSSGEAASAFWTVAPALLAPPPFTLAATAIALGFGVLVSTLRMVLGAHFLSDVAFSALLVLSLTLLMRRLILRD